MKRWMTDFTMFCKNKFYMITLVLTALCSYGFLITHQTVGIDDTPYAYYFEEGLVAIVGRWVLYLLNKLVHISDFAPFVTDLAAVLILMAAVTVWCTLFYSILKEKVPMFGYVFFSCLFLSNPLISEVFTYYLHNGVAIGYLCSGISLICFREGLLRPKKRIVLPLLGAATFLWIAIGCYESFMIVWLVGVLLILLTERMEGIKRNVFVALGMAGFVAVVGIVLRSIMIIMVTKGFGLESLQGEAVQRSLTEMLSWMYGPDALAEFAMVLKRIFIMYGVFAYAYYPIFVFVLAVGILLVVALIKSIQKKDAWIFLLMVSSFVACFLLIVVEGKATLYRSAQFLPLICAYGAFVVFCVIKDIKPRLIRGGVAFVFAIILLNQSIDMNKWFYVDYLKYEDAKNTMNQIAYELEKDFDTSKPVMFTGTYNIPKSIIKDAYVEYGSTTYYKMKKLADAVDVDLLDKFNREYGVWVAQTPSLSVIDWGRYAFDTDEELIRFFAMHGHELKPLLDSSLYAEAEIFSLELPHFPKEGSIVDRGEYIVVHF